MARRWQGSYKIIISFLQKDLAGKKNLRIFAAE
jgi:hypothetical protein